MLESIYFLGFHVPWMMPCMFVRGEENHISFVHNLLLEHPTSNLSPLYSTTTGAPKGPNNKNPKEQIKSGQEAHLIWLGIQRALPQFVKTMPINPLRTRELGSKLLDVFACSINTY